MKLNLDYYKKESLYQIVKSEEQIIEYIKIIQKKNTKDLFVKKRKMILF